MAGVPRLGIYNGRAKDVSCAGDNITYEVALHDKTRCSIQCIPELSYFRGGQPPWYVEAAWEVEDDEILAVVTKQDVTGPRKDSDIKLTMDNGALSYIGTRLTWKQPPPEEDKLKVKKAEIELARLEAQAKEAALAAEKEELNEKQAKHQAEAQAEQEEMQRMREELARQKEELRQLHEAREVEQRRRLEEEQRRRDELAAMEEKTKQEQEELARAREEQLQAAAKAEEERLAHTKQLEEEQAALEAQRMEVENNRAQSEAERAAKLAEVAAKEAEIQREREEVERQRAEEEALAQAQQNHLRLVEEELQDRASHLHHNEQVLHNERHNIAQSRGQLAVVHAHVASMLGKRDKHLGLDRPGAGHEMHNLDDGAVAEMGLQEDEVEPDSPEGEAGEDVWDMDWHTVENKGTGVTEAVAES
mmetsp:Transcript_95167/g.183510  ORF Transcript_95167/g.183510 Transcript_95167/m.183510 type:complete len:419 (+) Transcript_95167:131-1387(+)